MEYYIFNLLLFYVFSKKKKKKEYIELNDG